MRGFPLVLGLLGASIVIASLGMAPPASVTYLGGGTLVAKEQFDEPVVDSGALVCTTAGLGVGGGCVPFGAGDSIGVLDVLAGTNVAFQVCIDNDGDGLCGGDFGGSLTCRDEQFFSHHDSGAFFNPLGPLPKGFAPGCPGGAWPGYVVFLCQGTHVPVRPPGPPHVHAATEGTVELTTGGTGFGNFCQPTGFQTKAYAVVG